MREHHAEFLTMPQPLIQIVLGSSLIALGYRELNTDSTSKNSGFLENIENSILNHFSEDLALSASRAAAILLITVGLGICGAVLF